LIAHAATIPQAYGCLVHFGLVMSEQGQQSRPPGGGLWGGHSQAGQLEDPNNRPLLFTGHLQAMGVIGPGALRAPLRLRWPGFGRRPGFRGTRKLDGLRLAAPYGECADLWTPGHAPG